MGLNSRSFEPVLQNNNEKMNLGLDMNLIDLVSVSVLVSVSISSLANTYFRTPMKKINKFKLKN